ncbi:MAG: NAD-dependent epimerase/dehydratase family protein [Ilumatobacteraceae bacterium]
MSTAYERGISEWSSRLPTVTTTSVWVSDPRGALGSRVCGLLEANGMSRAEGPETASTVVWLTAHESVERGAWQRASVGDVSAVLAVTPAMHAVVVSSAMVYGAWPNNPVPLTEASVLRPDSEYAHDLLALEQTVDEWRRAAPGRSATVLRPTVSMAADAASGLAAALAAGMGQRFGEADPPAQFLHLDDLASAVILGIAARLDGVRNVAPDGYVPGERLRALTGAPPRVTLPARAREVVTGLRWRFERGPIPPGLVAYTRWPWVVANDRLVADGWRPTVTNEQAYVEGTEAPWWTMVSPKRRQEVALGGAAVAVSAVVGIVVKALRAGRVTAAAAAQQARR